MSTSSAKTAFEQWQEEEAAKPATTSGLRAPAETGPVTISPVTLTDQPTTKDFRALDPDTVPADVAAEIEREFSAEEDDGLDPTDAPTEPTDPIETGKPSPSLPSPSDSSAGDEKSGKNEPHVGV